MTAPAGWVPDRGEVIWINHNPQAGREMKDHHPFLVLSTAPFHTTVGLVVGCAMTSAAYNRGSSLAVDLGEIPGRPGAHSFVRAQPHPMGRLPQYQLDQVQAIVGQILGFLV